MVTTKHKYKIILNAINFMAAYVYIIQYETHTNFHQIASVKCAAI